MINLTLPDPIVGQWIWLSETNLNQESHQFYRRDFSIDEMPGKAEMWITARTAFHLFINGQHWLPGRLPTAAKTVMYIASISIICCKWGITKSQSRSLTPMRL